MERAACLLGLFYISLKFLIKIPLNTEIFLFSQRPYDRSVPPCSSKVGPLWKQTPFSRAFLYISSKVPSKGRFPPGSPHRAPSESDAPLPEPPFIRLSKSLVNEPPSRFPSGATVNRDDHLHSLPLHKLLDPQQSCPSSKFP